MTRLFMILLMFSFSQISSAFSYTIELTERSLQEKVSAMMPLEKKQYFFTVRLSEPRVELHDESNELSFFTHLDVIAPGGLKGGGQGEIQGSIRYEPATGEFFLQSPKLVDLDIRLIPKTLSPRIAALAELVLAKACAKIPIYRLKDDDSKHQLAKSTLKSIHVEDRKLMITLSMF